MNRSFKRCGTTLFILLALVAAPSLAQEGRDGIPRGTDIWTTPGDGSTYTDLSLPAGFLDRDCPPFRERVVLQGVPVATSPERAFGDADTIIERLEDAVFDEKGVARAKIIVRGLHFRSVAPLKTGCGEWTAEVGLAPQQKATEMTIVREGEAGGTFTAPISVDTVWTFTRGDGAQQRLTTSNLLTQEERTPWTSVNCFGKSESGSTLSSIMIDSDNDQRPDLKVALVSGLFTAGRTIRCEPWRPCRGKLIDPSIHCYEGAIPQAVAIDPSPIASF